MWRVGGAKITKSSGGGGGGSCDAIQGGRQEAIKDQLSDYKRTRRRRRGRRRMMMMKSKRQQLRRFEEMLPFHSFIINQPSRQSTTITTKTTILKAPNFLVCLHLVYLIFYLMMMMIAAPFPPGCHAHSLQQITTIPMNSNSNSNNQLALIISDMNVTTKTVPTTSFEHELESLSSSSSAALSSSSSQFDSSESAPKLIHATGSGDRSTTDYDTATGSGPIVGQGEQFGDDEQQDNDDDDNVRLTTGADRKLGTTTSDNRNLTTTVSGRRLETTNGLDKEEEKSSTNFTTSTQFNWLNSFFSHIDKQWKFAEIILIIVISAILNLVTIVGNIMVLISFKMDRS